MCQRDRGKSVGACSSLQPQCLHVESHSPVDLYSTSSNIQVTQPSIKRLATPNTTKGFVYVNDVNFKMQSWPTPHVKCKCVADGTTTENRTYFAYKCCEFKKQELYSKFKFKNFKSGTLVITCQSDVTTICSNAST